MTTINFRKTLIDLASKEGDDARIAKILAFYYPSLDLSGRDAFFESVMSFYKISENQDFDFEKILDELESDNQSVDVSKFEGKDFRIKNIEIANLRGIPEKDKNGLAYGLDLLDNETANNALILANNGTGKSSLFAGLEMIYAQEIGEKRLRTENHKSLNNDDYYKYISRFPNGGKAFCKVSTYDGDYSLDNVIFSNNNIKNIFNPSNFFISEYDIFETGKVRFIGDDKDTNSLHSLFALSLGLEEFIQLQKLLLQIPSYRRSKESSRRNAIEKELQEKGLFIKNSQVEIQSKTIELEQLKKNRKESTVSQVNQLDKLEKLRKLTAKDFDVSINPDEFERKLSAYNTAYTDFLSLVKNKRKITEMDFLNAGKELIHELENCPFCLNSNDSIEEILLNVQNRLNALKEIQELDKEIKLQYRNLSDLIWNSTKEFNRLYELVTVERGELTLFSNLYELNEKEGQIYVTLAPIINDAQLNEYIYSFTQKLIPNENDYQALFNLLNQNKPLFYEFYPDYLKRLKELSIERKTLVENEIQLISSNNETLTSEQKIIKLDEEIKKISEQIRTVEKEIIQTQKNYEDAQINAKTVDLIKDQVSNFNIKYGIEINILVNEVFEPIKDIVESIMNDYFIEDLDNYIEIHIKKKTVNIDGAEFEDKYIVAEIINRNTNQSITPDLYFNTFRYKLFCLMLNLSIALGTRKKYKLNLPLVMDDLFYASDFINKHSFSEFIIKVIQLFYKYAPDLPLQFIILTHDDVIFKSAVDSLDNFNMDFIVKEELCDENKIRLLNKTIIARLFNPKDKDEMPEKFNNGQFYWNLMYKLPKPILTH
jgi:hypothetical protein